MSNEGNIKDSILLILLKCINVGYSNGNKSFTSRLFSNYEPLNMLFHFFDISFIVFFSRLVKKFMKKLSFFSSNFKNPFQDVVYYRKLGCLTLLYWNGGPSNVSVLGDCFFRNVEILNFHESNILVMISHKMT